MWESCLFLQRTFNRSVHSNMGGGVFPGAGVIAEGTPQDKWISVWIVPSFFSHSGVFLWFMVLFALFKKKIAVSSGHWGEGVERGLARQQSYFTTMGALCRKSMGTSCKWRRKQWSWDRCVTRRIVLFFLHQDNNNRLNTNTHSGLITGGEVQLMDFRHSDLATEREWRESPSTSTPTPAPPPPRMSPSSYAC